MNWENMRVGTVVGEPNMSKPMPGRQKPGWKCALHRYCIGDPIWLFMPRVAEKSWSPLHDATDADVHAFANARDLLYSIPEHPETE